MHLYQQRVLLHQKQVQDMQHLSNLNLLHILQSTAVLHMHQDQHWNMVMHIQQSLYQLLFMQYHYKKLQYQ